MFFRKKSNIQTTEVAKESIKKMDTVVTGLILGGLIASIYGIKKIRDHRHDTERDDDHREEKDTEVHTETDIHAHPEKVGEKGLLRRLIFGHK